MSEHESQPWSNSTNSRRFGLYGAGAGLACGILAITFLLYRQGWSVPADTVPRQEGVTSGGTVLSEAGNTENPFGEGATKTFALFKLSRVRFEAGDIAGALEVVRCIDDDKKRDHAIEKLAMRFSTDDRLKLPDHFPIADAQGAEAAVNAARKALDDAHQLVAEIRDLGIRSRYFAALAQIRRDLDPLLTTDARPTSESFDHLALELARQCTDDPPGKSWPLTAISLLIAAATTAGGFLMSTLVSSVLAETGKATAIMFMKSKISTSAPDVPGQAGSSGD